MKTGTVTVGCDEQSLLVTLAARVQELYLMGGTALPADRVRINDLYREAYLAHRAHKIFIGEQDALLAGAI